MQSVSFHTAFFFFMIILVDAYPGKRQETCDAGYLRIGCYNDKHASGHRPLPNLLFTDRDRSSDKFSGMSVDWDNWDAYMTGLVCRCAERAKAGGYIFFGLQYYGECWASEEFTFNVDGLGEGCITSDFQPCTISSRVCVGETFSLFVYNVK